MKNLKKIAALVIVLAMALSTVAFGATFTDVAEDASYNEAVEVMSALGLLKGYEDGTFGPDKTITRAEFAAVVVRMLGMESAAAGAAVDTKFNDVTSAHWAAGYVQVANQQGIIAGYGDGTFGPDDEVTYEQAVKMIVCALGYDKMFEGNPSAYPAGYISQANTLGVTIGAIGRIGDKATRATVAKLAYNALDARKMKQTTFGTDSLWKDVDDTLLSENLKVAKVEASVTNQYFDKERLDKIKINATAGKYIYAYEASGATSSDYDYFDMDIKYDGATEIQRGYNCVAYIDFNKADKSDWELLAIVPKSGVNSTLTLTGKQIKDGSVTSTQASYFQNDSEVDITDKKIKLDGLTAYVNKNETAESFGTFAANWFAGNYTSVTLIDNDNDSQYEYAFASTYTAGIVEKIYDRTYRVDFKGGAISRETFNPEDEVNTYIIKDAEGNELTFADIKVGDTLNIVKSTATGSNLREVTVTNNKVEGAVAEVITAGSEYVIGSEEYMVGANATSSASSLVSGDAGMFTVDMFGKIIDFELNGGNRNFGMVYAIYPDESGVDTEAKAIIYTAKGEYVTYSFAKNVKVNGTPTAKEDLAVPAVASPYAPAYIDPAYISAAQQLVMYSVNSSNEINEIYYKTQTGVDGSGNPVYTDYIKARDGKYEVNASTSAVNYKASTEKVGNIFLAEDSVVVANKTATQGNISKRSDLSISSKALFDEDDTYTYDAIIDEDKNIVMIVVYGATAKVDKTSIPMYITAIGSSVDSEGNSVDVLSGYVDGEYKSIKVGADTHIYAIGKKATAVTDPTYTYPSMTGYTFAKGDVIQFIGEGEVVAAVRLIASFADYKDGVVATYATGYNAADDEDEGYIYMAKVADIEKNKTIKFVGGNNVDFNAGIIANLVQLDSGAYSRSFAAAYSFADVETNENPYGPHTTDATCPKCGSTHATDALANAANNDDYLLIYLIDDEAKAAVILDVEKDFE